MSHTSTRLRDASEGSSDAASDEVADAEGDNAAADERHWTALTDVYAGNLDN